MIKNNILRLCRLTPLLLIANPVCADAWYFDGKFSLTTGKYQNSELRNDAHSSNIQLSANYLERWGVNFRAGYSHFTFKQASNFEQNEYGFRLYKNIYSDLAKGTFTLLLGSYWIDEGNILQSAQHPEITYLNQSKSLLLGAGYANSRYEGRQNSKLTIHQLTGTLGFTLLPNNLWLSIKNYYINHGSINQYAIQPSLTSYIPRSSHLIPTSLTIGGLIGKRSYAVEQDTMLIYNVADTQDGSYFISAQWQLNDKTRLSFTAGSEFYNEETAQTNYQYNFINGGISVIW